MAQEIQRILIKYEADIKELRKDLDGAKKELKSVEKEGGRSGKALINSFKLVGGAIAAAFSVQQVIQFGKELNDLQKEAQGVRQAFNAAFDPGALQRLRDTTKGTLSDLELMKRALAAREFGIGPDLLAKGLEFARVQANKLGLEFDFLAESFVTGAGRKSIQILDNLGISQADLSEKVKETGDFYTALGAIIDEKLGKDSAASIETLADRQNRLNAQVENLRLRISDGLLPVFETLTSAALKFLDVLSNENSELEKQRDQLNLLVAEITNAKDGTEERADAIAELQRQYPDFLKNLNTEKLNNKELVEQLALANKEYTQRLALAEAGEELASKQAKVSRLLADQQREIAEATVESNKAIAEFGLTISEDLTGVDRVTAVQDALRSLFDTTDGAEAAFRRIANARGFLGPITEELSEAQKELNTETELYQQIAEGLNIDLTNTQTTLEKLDNTTDGAADSVSGLAEELEMLAEIVAFNELFDAEAQIAQPIEAAALRAKGALADLEQSIIENGEIRNQQIAQSSEQYNVFADDIAQANQDIALGVASAFSSTLQGIANATGDSAELAKAFLVFNKLIAVADVVINLNREIAAISANPALTAAPDLGASVKVPAIAAAKARAGVSIATILATAIPELAFAEGTSDAPGGVAWVGEEGPEIMHVPKGARVFTADASKRERSLIDAINEGRASAFIEETYVTPALSGFAENIAKSAPWQAYDDFFLRQDVKGLKRGIELGPRTMRKLSGYQTKRYH